VHCTLIGIDKHGSLPTCNVVVVVVDVVVVEDVVVLVVLVDVVDVVVVVELVVVVVVVVHFKLSLSKIISTTAFTVIPFSTPTQSKLSPLYMIHSDSTPTSHF
jgi:hypothetical protein